MMFTYTYTYTHTTLTHSINWDYTYLPPQTWTIPLWKKCLNVLFFYFLKTIIYLIVCLFIYRIGEWKFGRFLKL